MRVLIGFLVLVAGVGAVIANLAEPRRYLTQMTPIGAGEGRIANFSAVGEGDAPVSVAAAIPAFETRVSVPQSQVETASITNDTGEAFADPSPIDAATRAALARDIQTELARLGCYAGPINGSWSPETQRAAGLFTTEANARIPVSEPDFALFSLAKSATSEQSCGPPVTVARVPAAVEPPAMGLGGPGVERKAPTREPAYHQDRDVQSLFTNPLGR